MRLAALVLIFAATDAVAATKPRVLKLADGQVSVETSGDTDHVVIKDAKGQLRAESWCDKGDFDVYMRLFTDLKEEVHAGNKKAVAELVQLPLRVGAAKRSFTVRSESAFLKAYAKIFTPAVVEAIDRAEPAAVVCRDSDGMLGDGVIWARHGAVFAVNQPAPPPKQGR
jgi:hypothetical protein